MTEYEQELIALGQAVRRERHAEGLTIEALAHKAGMSTGHLGRIERGHGNPRWDTLSALASALDMSVSDRRSSSSISGISPPTASRT